MRLRCEQAVKAVVSAPDARSAAIAAFKAIDEFSDVEMMDGDAARALATALLAQWAPNEIE